jgi:putative oxidoreductase
VILIHFYVGVVFVFEAILKFLRPDALGPGRFDKVGIPAPASSDHWTGSSRSPAAC